MQENRNMVTLIPTLVIDSDHTVHFCWSFYSFSEEMGRKQKVEKSNSVSTQKQNINNKTKKRLHLYSSFAIHRAIWHVIWFDPKNPGKVDRQLVSLISQMKEMRLTEVEGFFQYYVHTKRPKPAILFKFGFIRNVGGYCTKTGKRSSLQKIAKHSAAEIIYLKYVSNLFIVYLSYTMECLC